MLAALNGVNTAAKTGEGEAPPRLVRAAHEFEGMMMKELLAPMTKGDALTGDDGDGGDLDSGSAGTLGQFASEALGQALSARGGLGIANLIIRQLSHSGNQHETGKVTTNLHGNTVMRARE
jgi:Rod binding domain-containing protein